MKLYSFYTPSHKEIKDAWFIPSFKDDWDLVLEEYEQDCISGEYMAEGWIHCMQKKVDLIIRAVEENTNQMFVHSDVDVQFFQPVIRLLQELLDGNDLIIQKESPNGSICPGFFAARGNNKNLQLWKDIRSELEVQNIKHDQTLLNEKLCKRKMFDFIRGVTSDRTFVKNEYNIKWNYLPGTFFSPGAATGKLWVPSDELQIPKGIVLHHANWTVGIENKLKQLEKVNNLQSNECCQKELCE